MFLLLIPGIICNEESKHRIIVYKDPKHNIQFPNLEKIKLIYAAKCNDKENERKCIKTDSAIEGFDNIVSYYKLSEIKYMDKHLSGAETALILVSSPNTHFPFDLSKVTCKKICITSPTLTDLYIKGIDVSNTIPVVVLRGFVHFIENFAADTLFIHEIKEGSAKANRVITSQTTFRNIVALQKQIYFDQINEISIHAEYIQVKFGLGSDHCMIKYKDKIGIVVNPYKYETISIPMILKKNCKVDSSIDIFIQDFYDSFFWGFLKPSDMKVVMPNYLAEIPLPSLQIKPDDSKWDDSQLRVNIATTKRSEKFFDVSSVPENILGMVKQDDIFEFYSGEIPDEPDDPDDPEEIELYDPDDYPSLMNGEEKKSNKKTIIIVVSILTAILAVVIAGVIYFMFRSKSKDFSGRSS